MLKIGPAITVQVWTGVDSGVAAGRPDEWLLINVWDDWS